MTYINTPDAEIVHADGSRPNAFNISSDSRRGGMSCAARTVTEIRLNCVLKSAKLFRPAFKLSTFSALAHTRLYAPLFAQTLYYIIYIHVY